MVEATRTLDRFLVVGLGSLGQHCVVALKEFGVKAIAIEQTLPKDWEIPNLPELLDDLIEGDSRHDKILLQAGIENCRAALIVTSSDRTNAETALAIRQLNPQTRLAIRSSQENLNQLLSEQLGNFIALEPAELAAPTFAIAALGLDTVGFFNIEGQWLRVVQQRLQAGERWCNSGALHEIDSRNRRLLALTTSGTQSLQAFHQWESNARARPGDTLAYIELTDPSFFNLAPSATKKRWKPLKLLRSLRWQALKGQARSFLQLNFQQQVRRVALACGAIVSILLLIGTLLFKAAIPETSFLAAFYTTAILLLGGYSDLFNPLQPGIAIPWGLQSFALVLTLAGTAFVGVLYALLTEALLSAKFQFAKKRPPIPETQHVILIGLGRVGQRVARMLLAFRQPFVGLSLDSDFDRALLPEMPLLTGNLQQSLARANIATAKSVIVATDDEILNLEAALAIRKVNPTAKIALRTYGRSLSHHLAKILPDAQVLSAHAVTAEAFVGAAFGENILSLFRLNWQTILVTEYQIEADDTLHGLLLSEIAYGYGVIPLWHQKYPEPPQLMPSDDLRLSIGDRLIVLATINGLRRVEMGKPAIRPKQWRLRVEKAIAPEAIFEGANLIARISGCSLASARELMKALPNTLNVPLYQHQAERLVRELQKARVTATVVPTRQP